MAYDSHRGVTVSFGGWHTNGAGEIVTLGDMWEWNGTDWRMIMAHSATEGWTPDLRRPTYQGRPVHRAGHNLVYDSARRRLVLFGGETRSREAFQVILNDIWEWDGVQWHFGATNGPVHRINAGMAYDSDRALSVMYGGFLNGPGDPIRGSVWEWDGTQWNLHTPTNGPATNYSQDIGAMAYDGVRRKTLFGPAVGGNRWVFWLWDGRQWEQHDQHVAELWNLQYGDLVFDTFRERGIWFGGISSYPTNVTGFFDGERWEVLTNTAAYPPPSGRTHQTMAYDAMRRTTVMFGGDTYYSPLNVSGETWELISVDIEPPDLTCPADISVEATRPCGANVELSATATDKCGGSVTISISPPSRSLFAIGDTTVTCTATDDSGNVTNCTFVVTVRPQAFPTPTVANVLPQSIALAGGTQITVRGTGFTADDEIFLGGQPLRYPVLVSAEEIQGQTPGLTAGSYSVQVRRCGVFVAQLHNAVQAEETSRISATSFGYAFASGGSRITITGANFTPDTQIRVGFSGPLGANLLRNISVSADGTTITGEIPSLPANEALGPRSLIVENSGGSTVLQRGVTYLPNIVQRDPQLISLNSLQAASAQPVEVTWRNSFPSALSARVTMPGATPVERARSFLGTYKDLFRLGAAGESLRVARVSEGPLSHVKLVQDHQGLPVFGAEMVVTLAGDQVLGSVGELVPPERFAIAAAAVHAPMLSAAQAEAIARTHLSWTNIVLHRTSRLEIFDPRLFADPGEPMANEAPVRVWRVWLRAAAVEVFVDAQTGRVVFELPLQIEDEGLGSFYMELNSAEDEANAKDDLCFELSDDTFVGNQDGIHADWLQDTDTVAAWWHIRYAYLFFHDNFGFHSYDNDGAEIEIFIHSTVASARWSHGCDTIEFRRGRVDYEVMVHELTHGIIGFASELTYHGESGALNESYADLMAVFADRQRGDPADMNWTFAENRTIPDRPGRDISNPTNTMTTGPGAGHYTNPALVNYWNRPDDEDNDWGGVHYNSGIPNKAGYLMSEGVTNYGGYYVRGMGPEKTMHLKFHALVHLPSRPSFASARQFEIMVAQGWAERGVNGFTREDVCTVRNAWAAVGVGMGDSNCDGIEDNNHDIDGDFIPNQVDNCPTVPNQGQQNSDGDRFGDACDNCTFVVNDGQEDYDRDGQGDVCDTDRDGDGCLNIYDQDPNSDFHRIGTSLSATCQERATTYYGPASGNSDQSLPDADPFLDCEDLDDDNDGIPDFGWDGIPGTADDDPCPTGSLPNAVSGTECGVIGRDCPRASDTWWQTCLGGGCNQFYARIIDKINPDPTRETLVDNIRIVNQTLYMAPAAGATVANVARAIALPRLAGAQAHMGQPDEERRVEIWARATETEPAHLVAVVGDFQTSQLQLGNVSTGALLAFTPAASDQPATLAATWHVGADPATIMQDSDGDGLPDGWERRHGLNPSDGADGTADMDSDGMNNLAEFQAGTDPRSGDSRVALLSARRQTAGMEIQFLGPPGRRVQLEKTLSLGGVWATAGEAIQLQGGVTVLMDASAAASQGFYRVRVLPE